MLHALLRAIHADDELEALVVQILRNLADTAPHIEDNGPLLRDILSDHVPDALVVLNPLEFSLVPKKLR